MTDFTTFGLPEGLLHKLEHLGFNIPTPIQEKAIPIALEGKDILGSAQTGTGKTGAFGIPALNKLMTTKQGNVLIVTPTRELAAQVHESLTSMLAKNSKIQAVLLIGGVPIIKQLNKLKAKPRLIVGTPGRINDHLRQGTLDLSNTDFLVLDETDRMLDMGFSVQINEILEHMPEQRQTLLFSATLPKNIIALSKRYLTNPERISVGETHVPAQDIKQETVHVDTKQKYDVLVEQLKKRKGSVIIFVKTKYSTEKIAGRLKKDGHKATAIHGDLRHNKRAQVTKAFRDEKFRILVATDVAARGLDISHIAHVINYDMPQVPEDYIHRIGRTARAGAKGEALNLIAPIDTGKWHAIEMLIDPEKAKEHKKKLSQNRFNRKKPMARRRGKKKRS